MQLAIKWQLLQQILVGAYQTNCHITGCNNSQLPFRILQEILHGDLLHVYHMDWCNFIYDFMDDNYYRYAEEQSTVI